MAPRTGHHHRNDTLALTARQRDVLALVAAGKTNMEIADELGIGFESVKTHVSEILARLDVESREEAGAAWRADQGLASRFGRAATGFFVTGLGKVATGAVAAIVLVAGVSAVVYVANDGDAKPGTAGQLADPEPAGRQPGATADWQYQRGDIHEARLDLATRLNIAPLEISLWQMRGAFWNGCVGVSPKANPGCDDLGVFGHTVDFAAKGQLYRYHVGNDRFVAMDWVKDVDIDDGQDYMEDGKKLPLPDSSRDFSRAMTLAVGDLELRTGISRGDWTRVSIDHVTFADGCLGFERATPAACRSGAVPGAIVDFAHGAEQHRYHVSLQGIVAVDLEPGKATVAPDPAVLATTLELREHLAMRLSVAVDDIAVDDFIDVVWGDSCLAIHYPGTTCTDTEIDGYWAAFRAAGPQAGVQWTYHGTDAGFEIAWPPPDEFTQIRTWKRRRD